VLRGVGRGDRRGRRPITSPLPLPGGRRSRSKKSASSKHTGSAAPRPSRLFGKHTESGILRLPRLRQSSLLPSLERVIPFDTRPARGHPSPTLRQNAPLRKPAPARGMKAALRQRGALRYPRREPPRLPPIFLLPFPPWTCAEICRIISPSKQGGFLWSLVKNARSTS